MEERVGRRLVQTPPLLTVPPGHPPTLQCAEAVTHTAGALLRILGLHLPLGSPRSVLVVLGGCALPGPTAPTWPSCLSPSARTPPVWRLVRPCKLMCLSVPATKPASNATAPASDSQHLPSHLHRARCASHLEPPTLTSPRLAPRASLFQSANLFRSFPRSKAFFRTNPAASARLGRPSARSRPCRPAQPPPCPLAPSPHTALALPEAGLWVTRALAQAAPGLEGALAARLRVSPRRLPPPHPPSLALCPQQFPPCGLPLSGPHTARTPNSEQPERTRVSGFAVLGTQHGPDPRETLPERL